MFDNVVPPLFKKKEAKEEDEIEKEEGDESDSDDDEFNDYVKNEVAEAPSQKQEITLGDQTNPLSGLKFNYNAEQKSMKEQAKDFVDLAATSKAVEDEELVDEITDYKKEELKESASTSLKEEKVRSSKVEKELQHANYGIYEGIAELIGLKKPLPNVMLKALMYILIPFLIIYYFVVGFITGIINITMDCVNSVVTRFAEFTKPAKKIILFVLITALVATILVIIYAILNHYGIFNMVKE